MKVPLARFYAFRALALTWIYVPFQWLYLRDHGLSGTELMSLNAVFCLAAVLFEVPTGALADRLGRRPLLVAGALASSLSSVLFLSLPSSVPCLVAANVLAALAMTCISGADSAYLHERLVGAGGGAKAYERAEATSSAVGLTAGAVGGVAAWAVIAGGGSLGGLYLASAVLAALAALLGSGLREPRAAGAPGGPPGPSSSAVSLAAGAMAVGGHARRAARITLGRRDLLLLFALSALLFPVFRVGLFLDQPYLRGLGVATAVFGLAYAAKDLMAAGAAAATVRLLPVLGAPRLLVALPLAAGLALAAMGFASGPGAVLLVLVPMAAFGVYSPLVRILVNERIAENGDRATVLSIEGMARRLGFAAFSPLVGAVFDLWSLRAALVLSSLWAVAATLFALALAATARARRRSPAPVRLLAGEGPTDVPGLRHAGRPRPSVSGAG